MNDHRAKPPIVLIVDDEPRNLQLLGSLLYDDLGCDLCFATNGREALDSVASVTPDLVLLDVNMPDMNGYQVCAAFHETDGCREIPVIFITALGEQDDIVRGFEAGGSDYVVKPFERRELLARVRVHLELKLGRDELKRKNDELEEAIARIRRLEGILPICSFCKKIRNEQNLWEQLEAYLTEHSDVLFSHGICPECREKHYSYLKKRGGEAHTPESV